MGLFKKLNERIYRITIFSSISDGSVGFCSINGVRDTYRLSKRFKTNFKSMLLQLKHTGMYSDSNVLITIL